MKTKSDLTFDDLLKKLRESDARWAKKFIEANESWERDYDDLVVDRNSWRESYEGQRRNTLAFMAERDEAFSRIEKAKELVRKAERLWSNGDDGVVGDLLGDIATVLDGKDESS